MMTRGTPSRAPVGVSFMSGRMPVTVSRAAGEGAWDGASRGAPQSPQKRSSGRLMALHFLQGQPSDIRGVSGGEVLYHFSWSCAAAPDAPWCAESKVQVAM